MNSLAYTLFGGFAMALADSVPGVSGGTIAFLLGFYDRFVGALDALVHGARDAKKARIIFRRCGQKRAFALKYAPQEDEL